MTAISMFPTFLNAGNTWNGTRPNEVFLRNHEATQEQCADDASPVADTLTRLLDLLDEHGNDDYGVIDPTQYAFKSAFKLVRLAQQKMVLRVAGSASVDSLGGIRITWRRNGREIRLVCPASQTEQIYLY